MRENTTKLQARQEKAEKLELKSRTLSGAGAIAVFAQAMSLTYWPH